MKPRHVYIIAIGASLLVLAGALALKSAWKPKQERISDYPRGVIDGDTLVFPNMSNPVRLAGIDAPEMGQPCLNSAHKEYDCGKLARRELVNIIGKSKLDCTVLERDIYDRYVARCYAGKLDIGRRMVELGFAVAYRGEGYRDYEVEAKTAKIGIHAGLFQRPVYYRLDKRRADKGGA